MGQLSGRCGELARGFPVGATAAAALLVPSRGRAIPQDGFDNRWVLATPELAVDVASIAARFRRPARLTVKKLLLPATKLQR
jgi:hypothetical protein